MAMMESIPATDPDRVPRLHIKIWNDEPLSAEVLGRYIRELGADYRRATGGLLVLSKIELASTSLTLIDAAVVALAAAGGFNTLIDAGERISKFYKIFKQYLKGENGTKVGRDVQKSGQRTFEIGATYHARFEISQNNNNGQSFSLSFEEAATKYAIIRENRKKTTVTGTSLLDVKGIADSFRVQAQSNPNQAQELIEVIVRFLKMSGASYQLPALAYNLELNGLDEIARIVRTHIDDGDDGKLLITRD